MEIKESGEAAARRRERAVESRIENLRGENRLNFTHSHNRTRPRDENRQTRRRGKLHIFQQGATAVYDLLQTPPSFPCYMDSPLSLSLSPSHQHRRAYDRLRQMKMRKMFFHLRKFRLSRDARYKNLMHSEIFGYSPCCCVM